VLGVDRPRLGMVAKRATRGKGKAEEDEEETMEEEEEESKDGGSSHEYEPEVTLADLLAPLSLDEFTRCVPP